LLASGSNDGFVKIWNLSNGKLRNTLKHANQVRKLIALNDSLLASASWDNTIKIWYIN
jgi:WD40 repeat protein